MKIGKARASSGDPVGPCIGSWKSRVCFVGCITAAPISCVVVHRAIAGPRRKRFPTVCHFWRRSCARQGQRRSCWLGRPQRPCFAVMEAFRIGWGIWNGVGISPTKGFAMWLCPKCWRVGMPLGFLRCHTRVPWPNRNAPNGRKWSAWGKEVVVSMASALRKNGGGFGAAR